MEFCKRNQPLLAESKVYDAYYSPLEHHHDVPNV